MDEELEGNGAGPVDKKPRKPRSDKGKKKPKVRTVEDVCNDLQVLMSNTTIRAQELFDEALKITREKAKVTFEE